MIRDLVEACYKDRCDSREFVSSRKREPIRFDLGHELSQRNIRGTGEGDDKADQKKGVAKLSQLFHGPRRTHITALHPVDKGVEMLEASLGEIAW